MTTMAEHTELIAEIPLVEKLPTQDRLKHAKKRRSQQLKRYQQYDKMVDKDRKRGRPISSRKNSSPSKRRKSKKMHLSFTANVVFLEAAARNDIEEVRMLLQQGVTADVTNEDGLTALHQCCIDDCEDMMKLLLEYGATVNARDSELWTPLHAAATCGHLHLCKILVERGAELLSVNADGNMPYDICEDEKTLDYVETQMADRGVTQDLIDETRLSTEKQMIEDLKNVRKDGGNLERRDRVGATPLHIAAANGYLQVAEFLLDNHVNVDIRDNDDWTAVHAAACWGQPVILDLLIQNGADLEAKTKNGETPFDICEDAEFKQRILEMQEEISNNKASRMTELSKKKQHNTRSANLINSSTGSLYSSNTSLADKHSMSASIRRTSMREKSQLSWKAAREEAKYFMGAMAQQEETTNENGLTDKVEEENLPVSNIDDIRLVTNGEESVSNDSPLADKHVTLVEVQSPGKASDSSDSDNKHEIRHDTGYVTTVKINSDHLAVENQASSDSSKSSEIASQSDSSRSSGVRGQGDSSRSNEVKVQRDSRSSEVIAQAPQTDISTSKSKDSSVKGVPTKSGPKPGSKGTVSVVYNSAKGESSKMHKPVIIVRNSAAMGNEQKTTNNSSLKENNTLVKNKSLAVSNQPDRDKTSVNSMPDKSNTLTNKNTVNANNSVKAPIKNGEQLSNHNNNIQNSQTSTFSDPPIHKFVAHNSNEVVGWDEEEKKCCIIM